MATTTDPAADSDRWLDDALENVRKQAWFMKRSLDSGDLLEALKYAASMIDELRTGKLGPKDYYSLWMDVTGELRELEAYLGDEDAREDGLSIVDIYEHVQHAGNIIPRLYLLATVGSVYIKSQKAPARDILFDLVELCRGVQHPLRGLFLRNYLSSVTKDKLPDVGTAYNGEGGAVQDAIEFVLQGLEATLKLWTRMQHLGPVRERQRREKERLNLRQLVGANLVRLSELEGVTSDIYADTVLPRILEQTVNSKDKIAQEYLFEVVISVFPDAYHLRTLDVFLGTLSQLQKSVNVKNIIVALMDRLSNFAKEAGEDLPADMFPLFLQYSSQVIESNPKMGLADTLQLQVALVNFASSVYPDNIEYVDRVLGFSVQCLEKTGKASVERKSAKHVVQLLTLPLESLVLRILELEGYSALMSFLEYSTRKQVAINIIDAVVKANQMLDSVEATEKLFLMISPVLKDQEDQKDFDHDDFEFDQEQTKAAQLFQLIVHPDTDVQYKLYALVRRHFGQGGERRISYSLPPLVFGCLDLARRVYAREAAAAGGSSTTAEDGGDEVEDGGDEVTAPAVKTKKICGFIHEIILVLGPHNPEIALRLFLQAAKAADDAAYEAISYEFVAQAFILYEEELSDSKAQIAAVSLIVATLQQMSNLGEEEYDTLATKATQHSAKLLRKPEQSRAVCNCAHLFWRGTADEPGHQDERRVLECLQRALKIANTCMGRQVFLFVEILNHYLFFFERRCPSIQVKFLKGLIALIDEHVPNLDNSEASQNALRHYQNTRQHIMLKQELDDETGERYRAITNDAEE